MEQISPYKKRYPPEIAINSSLQTELEQQCPTNVVYKWLGNAPEIANKHYLTVTNEHFEMASDQSH